MSTAAADTNDPWGDVLNTRYTAASKKFERLAAASPEDPLLTVAYAASLLRRDPMTRGNVRKAREILQKTVATLPVSETHYRPLALLLLGRIDHDHVEPVQAESARGFYEQLRREYPQHALADQASVQLCYLRYMVTAPSRHGEVVAEVEETLPTVSGQVQRFHLRELAVTLYLNLKDEVSALTHLLAAQEEASPDKSLDLHIGYLARRLGRYDLAAKHYRAFYEGSPNDDRAYTARRLAGEYEALASAGIRPNTRKEG